MAHTLSAIVPVAAQGHGDLDGFAIQCSCGERAAFSYRQMAADHGRRHVEFMTRQEAQPRRRSRRA